MVFYNKEGKPCTYRISRNNFIGKGLTAKVFRISDNKCLKIFRNDNDYCSFNEELFSMLKTLSLDSFGKLYDSFYRDSLIKAFTMEYVKENSDSILSLPTDYTLGSFNSIHNDFIVLADKKVLVNDLLAQNVIVGEESIKIIDYDRSEVSKREDIIDNNMWWLLYMFRELYRNALIKENIPDDGYNNGIINELFGTEFDRPEDLPKVLKRNMGHTKKPSELFRR